MNDRHIAWARAHDWYVRTIGDAVIVREVMNGRPVRYLRFDAFAALYRWAGY